MAVNLQRHTGRDLGELESHLRDWFWQENSPLGRVTRVTDARYVEGAGTANETVVARCVTTSGGHERSQGIVIRMTVPVIAAYLDVDLERQARILDWVAANTDVPVPRIYGVEATGNLLGAPFIVMEQLEGQVPPDYPVYNASGFVADMHPEDRSRLWESAFGTMTALHRADASSIDFLPGDLNTGLAELVGYWRRMFDWVHTRTPLDRLRPYLEWAERELPHDSPPGLSWGDARLGNMMFDGARCNAVLDWEMASLGGPLVDLSWWLMFDINHSDDSGVARLEGLPGRAETIERWERATGLDSKNLAWHQVFSLLQLAVLRANAFEGRARLGLEVPEDDDPRSVVRLVRRMDAFLDGTLTDST